MSVRAVVDGICQYLGGPYDAATRSYRTPQVPGVGVVRRAWAKRDDHNDYTLGMAKGTATGCQIIVHIARTSEARFALGGAYSGRKNVLYEVHLLCYVRSTHPHAEDAQDDIHDLADAIVAHLRADRTLGGAVFEAGEAVDGGQGSIDVEFGQVESKGELSKGFLLVSFPALEIIAA